MPTPASPPTLARYAASGGALVLLTLLTACGSSSSSTAGDSSPSSGGQSTSTSGVTCDYPDAPQGKTGDATKPPSTPTVQGQVSVTMTTSLGPLDATLDAGKAPCTVNSFVSLAKQGFFDKSPCHRLTTPPSSIFVLQCGDPTGTGTGGPGYTVPDELSGNESYGAGTLAMAKTSQPDSGGSQFFIVYKDSSVLPQDYTVFGQLDAASIKAVQKLAKKGSDDAFSPGDGHPKVPVTIESVTVG